MEVKIIDYDHLGRGIGKINGKVIFVPKTTKNNCYDVDITINKNKYLIGEVKEKEKIKYCPYYNECGSCTIAHLSLEEQLKFKKNMTIDILKRYANIKLNDINIIPTKSNNYRNKVTFHIEKEKLGFYKEKTNQLIDIDKCNLLDENILLLTSFLKSFIQTNHNLTKATIKNYGNNSMLILNGKEDKQVVKEFFQSKVTSLYYNDELLSGTNHIIATIFNNQFLVRKNSFFQVNKEGLEIIYSLVIKIIKELNCNIVYDLFCGTGTIGILISPYVSKVIGIELNHDAYLDCLDNSKLNNITNAEFYEGDVFKVLKNLKEPKDTIIIDPPRSGLSKKTIDLIFESDFQNIIYVSCNIHTLSRDLKLLTTKYNLEKISIIDEFPNTNHVECITLLQRKQN